MDEVVERSGDTILGSSARNAYTVNRAKRMVKRSVWALQCQLRQGEFYPALTEWAFGPEDQIDSLNFLLEQGEILSLRGRVDRIDLCEGEDDQLFVKVIDYKSGTTKLDLVKLYYGLQLQLALYLNAAMELEQKRFPGKKAVPAGIFYYNIKDPILNQEDIKDPEHPEPDVLKKMKMDGIAGAEPEILEKLDRDLAAKTSVESMVVPVKYTAKGGFSSNSKVAYQEQFHNMMCYVNEKAKGIGQEILNGNTEVNPFEKQKENACEYCPYRSVCGFDEKIPGYTYRRLHSYSEDEIWKKIDEDLHKDKSFNRKEK